MLVGFHLIPSICVDYDDFNMFLVFVNVFLFFHVIHMLMHVFAVLCYGLWFGTRWGYLAHAVCI